MWHRTFNMKLLIFFAGFILVVVQCHVLPKVKYGPLSKVQSHIINGVAALDKEFPYQVAVFTYTSPTVGMRCGASLIHASWVLSAAHCFLGGTEIKLRFGSNLYSSGGVIRNVNMTELYIHPMYKLDAMINATGRVNPVHDIALIKLNEPINIAASNGAIAVVKLLPKSMTCGNTIRTFYASGWGLTDDRTKNGTVSEKLMWIAMNEVPNYICMNTTYGLISATHMCANGIKNTNITSTCSGDSGGPLVIRSPALYQVSLNSFGSSNCILGNPRVQQAVTPYLDWMKYVTGITFGV